MQSLIYHFVAIFFPLSKTIFCPILMILPVRGATAGS